MSANNLYSAKKAVLIGGGLTLAAGISSIASLGTVFADSDMTTDVSITIPASCTYSATTNGEYQATITPGNYNDNIGNNTFNIICNDNDGYSVYAIGYSNDTYGNTNMINSSANATIATGTAITGGTSSWSMMLSAVSGTYAPTISNGTSGTEDFTTFHAVPSNYTKVATFPSITDHTIGSSFQSKYRVYVSESQAPGAYVGKVKYVLVHPASSVAGTYTIAYNANGGTGTMTSSTNVLNFESFTLPDSTFTAPSGYQFAGWCTTPGTSPYTTCSGTSYSAGDSVTSLATAGSTVNLYAYWELEPKNISNSTYLQEVVSCPSTLTTGRAYTLLDSRDNTTYHVAKLADGRCWMLDNLALDLINVGLSDLQGKTNTSNAALNYLKNGGGTPTDQYPTAGVTTFTGNNYSIPNMIASGTCYDSNCVNDPTTGNWTKDSVLPYSIGAIPNSMGDNKIGIYYNYCAASAGTYCWGNGTSYDGSPTTDPDSGSLVDIDGDICPLGWRMPTSTENGEYQALYSAYSSNYTNFRRALSTPLSGVYGSGSAWGQGGNGYFWSSTWGNTYNMGDLYMDTSNIYHSDSSDRDLGFSVRCVKDNTPTMQEVTTAQLNSWLPNTGDTMTLKDSRDNQKYTVGKLADGNVWLLDNLALDLINVDLSDLQGKTNTSNAALNYLKNGGGTPTDQYPTAGVGTFTSSNEYSVPRISLANKDVVPQGNQQVSDPLASEALANNWKVGGYYNYCAASAGTYCWGDGTSYAGSPTTDPNSGTLLDVQEDICPKGWRMPTGATDGEYQALYSAYSSNYTDFRRALSAPLSGYYSSGSALGQGGYGIFWSSTWYDAYRMGNLYMTASSIYPSDYGGRYDGFSVRCIKD